MNKKYLLAIIGGLIIIISACVLFLFVNRQPKYTITETPNTILFDQNKNYKLATTARLNNDFKTALTYYQSSLSDAHDAAQEALVRYYIAYTTELSGDHLGAIKLYKDIAANSNFHPLTRALALQRVAIIYTLYNDREAITKETFKDSLYQKMLEGGDVKLANRRLCEYVTSLYPLGLCEVSVAMWYSHELVTNLKGATTTPIGKNYVGVVNENIKLADVDMERAKNDPLELPLVGNTYAKAGAALGDLATVGAANPATVETYFQKSLEFDTVMGTPPGTFSRYYYAEFLMKQYGKSRVDDIKKILSLFSESSLDKIHPAIPQIFGAARTDASLTHIKPTLVSLAKIDPDFKKYLIYLGWHETDFGTKL